MDNNNKLQDQVDKLEKLVAYLTTRVTRLESENKKLKSRVVVQTTDISNIRAFLRR